MIICSNCNYENLDGTQICVRCGTPLVDISLPTRTLGNTDFEEGMPKWGLARFNGAMNLVLTVLETEQMFVFDAEHVSELVMGRRNNESEEPLAVDLSKAGGMDLGVSRKHAMVLRRDGALHVMDFGSANGTYLNGQKLVAQQPRILRDGDDIRLGHLVLRVTFRPR